MADSEFVILVDEDDRPTGRMEKMAAHRGGELHRAFSIMLGNGSGQVLLQRRALGKYHCGGLWANSCCGHPRPGEDTAAAAARRLGEELNLGVALTAVGTFRYRAEVDNGLVEHELVHLFHGAFDGEVAPNPAEVMETRWVEPTDLRSDDRTLAPWFSFYIAGSPGFLRVGRAPVRRQM